MIRNINKKINYLKIKEISKIVLFVLYIYCLIFSNEIIFTKKLRESNLKVCVCTLGKDENKYIREFVEHYKNIGVDKIYLYDNNELDGERFENIIGDYINNKFVDIINWRGVKGTSTYYRIMDSCYQEHYNKYDWLIFYEIDEFLYTKNYKNIKEYLTEEKFNECGTIQLNWVHMSDNNQILYENKTLKERFPKIGKNVDKFKFNKICYIKTIIRGHLYNINITHNHILSENVKACDGFGRKSRVKGIISLYPDYKLNYIKHYYGKSVQEFIEKINRGDLLRGNEQKIVEWAIEKYFYINEITPEKIKYIQAKLGTKYNLTEYIKQLECKI